MKSIKPLVLSFSLAALAGAVYADDAKKESRNEQAEPAMSQSDNKASGSASAGASATQKSDSTAMSAKKLIGTDVVDAQGKDMGEIKEVVLDLHNARVHSAVFEFGGFMGIGDKQYAFPVSELKSAKERDKLALNVDKDKLKSEQGFEKDKWPAMDDKYWSGVASRDKSAAGGPQRSGQKVNLHRASKLMGQEVQDKSGRQVGEIRDVLLSSDRGRIQHIVIDLKGAGEARIEPKALSLGTGDKLMVNMSADQLKGQAGKRDKQAQSESTTASASKKSFSELDRDNDGTLSRVEAAADADTKSNFEKLDKNNDQKLSRSEWEAGQGAAAGGTAKSEEPKSGGKPQKSQ